MFIAYVIAFTARANAGLQDCDVARQQGLGTSLCTNGTQFIRNNKQLLLAKFQSLAAQIAQNWGTTTPLLWMTEPDYYQYSVDDPTQADPFTYEEAGQYMRDFLTAVRQILPNIVFALDTAPWMGARAAAWFAAMPMDMLSYMTVYGEPTEYIQGPSSASYGNSWPQFHMLTGLPILSEGWAYNATDGTWHTPAAINALISWGVISESFRDPPSDWANVAAGNASQLNPLLSCPQ
jgi:hypothetical protein